MDRETVARKGRWRKSRRSEGTGNCVEVADNLPGVAGVRDSKDPSGPVLVFGRQSFGRFVQAARDGRFGA